MLEYGKLEILESLSYVVMQKFEGGSEKFVVLNIKVNLDPLKSKNGEY